MAVVNCQRTDFRRQPGGQRVGKIITGNGQNAASAFQFGCRFGHRRRVIGKYGDVNIVNAQRKRAGQRLVGGRIQVFAIMFGNNENSGHYSSPRDLSSDNSSSTEPTTLPPLRLGGGSKACAVMPPARSTPSSSQAMVYSGMRRSFMMSGSLTKRGSLM